MFNLSVLTCAFRTAENGWQQGGDYDCYRDINSGSMVLSFMEAFSLLLVEATAYLLSWHWGEERHKRCLCYFHKNKRWFIDGRCIFQFSRYHSVYTTSSPAPGTAIVWCALLHFFVVSNHRYDAALKLLFALWFSVELLATAWLIFDRSVVKDPRDVSSSSSVW